MVGIEAGSFLEPARERGFHTWCGVPCSYLKPFINYIIDADGLLYVSSANEGDAVATATGAALTGERSVVMMQNSGLGNAVSPLSSLNWVFRLPVLLIITLRGDPDGQDEPQHELMGRVTASLLDTLEIRWDWFPDTDAKVRDGLETATAHMDRTGLPYAFIMKKGTVAPYALRNVAPDPEAAGKRRPNTGRDQPEGAAPSRQQVLEQVVSHTDPASSVVIASTGYNGRELYAIDDRPNHLYMVGSMGCAASLGLGMSLTRPQLRTVVCDGDGGALMRMGNFATVGRYAGRLFNHVLLDNGAHESTGGQATVSGGVDFPSLAGACGYRWTGSYTGEDSLGSMLLVQGGPAFLHVRTRRGVRADLPRPHRGPAGVKQRLMRHFGFEAGWRDAGA